VPKTAWLLLNVFDEFFQATEHFNLIISFVDHTIVWVFYPYYTLGSSYQPFRIKIHGALAVTFFFSPWPDFLQVGPDQFEKASAAGGGTGNPFEGGFGNPFEDIFSGGGGGGGGMNDVCCPHIILIVIAYHLIVLCLLVCFLLASSISALQCYCKETSIVIHESYFIFVLPMG
jgi:hypothetical protein